MAETHPKSSPESIQAVKDMFTLDPSNNKAIINAIAYLYEENKNLRELIAIIAGSVNYQYYEYEENMLERLVSKWLITNSERKSVLEKIT